MVERERKRAVKQAASKTAAKDAPKISAKDAPRSPAQDAPKTPAKDAAKETAKRTQKVVANGASREKFSQTRTAVRKAASRGAAKETGNDTAKDAARTASEDAPAPKTITASKNAAARRNATKVAAKSPGQAVSRKRPADKVEMNGDTQVGFLADYVGFHLRLAQDASYRAFARHRDKDLIKPGRFPALAIIHLNPGISQSALGRAISRDKSTVSPLIKDLQKNGFISRKPSASDRRSVTLALTKKGERTLDRLHVRAKEHEDELDRLVGSSKGRLMVLLGKITSGLTE